MKVFLFNLAAIFTVLTLSACSTAGYAAGRTMEKTGHVVSHGGREIVEHTQ